MSLLPTICQSAYDTLLWTATPWLRRHLQKRIGTGKELASRLDERYGIAAIARPAGRLVWLHGASAGESIALLPIVMQLRALPVPPTVLVTTGSVTSSAIMASRLPDGCIHQFIPLDRKKWVDRFLDHWQPDGVVWMESEIWPRLLASIHARRIPAIFLNARISEKSTRNWLRFKSWIRALLSPFNPVTAVTPADAARWQQLAGTTPTLIANLKFIVPPLSADAEALAILHGDIGNRPVWTMAVIHPGEEIIAADVHRALKQQFPDLLTLVVPRHPHRGIEFAATLRGQGLSVSVRSVGETITPTTDIYIADIMGEMGLLYRLAKIVVIGGSFVPHGGQSPIEAAKLGAAILYGPQMFNFAAITEAFEAAESVIPVADATALAEGVCALLLDPHAAAVLGARVQAVCADEEQSVARIWEILAPWRAKVGI